MHKEASYPVFYLSFVTATATLGGFLFGFDSGVISGAVGALREAFGLSSFGSGLNVSSMLLGCAAGALVAGRLADRFGRLAVLRVSALFFLISAWGSGVADTSSPFIAYRVVGGLAVGAASVICPAYISEIAPARIRGRLGSLQQMAIVLGLFLSFLSNYGIAAAAGSAEDPFWWGYPAWRWMFWAEIIPAALFGIMLFLLPESPRYLVKMGKKDRAMEVLRRLSHPSDADAKYREILETFAQKTTSAWQALQNPQSGKLHGLVWVGIMIAAFQQLTGINIVFYYGPVMWQAAGFSEASALFKTLLSGGLNILATLIAISLVDQVGRKPMLLSGAVGMTLSLSVVAFVFSGAPVGSEGNLQLSETRGLTALLAANVYVFCFATTWGPVVWVLLGEMFPNRMRGVAISLCGLVMWMCNFLITVTFEGLLTILGLGITYWIYAFFSLLSVLLTVRFVRETKNKTLEEMG